MQNSINKEVLCFARFANQNNGELVLIQLYEYRWMRNYIRVFRELRGPESMTEIQLIKPKDPLNFIPAY
jgi:hypothetical protein